MLRISPESQEIFVAQAMPVFSERVRVALADKYPFLLPQFPEPVQTKIVANMLGRARLWGLTQQSTLLAFCEFMVGIAGNFDLQPQINAELRTIASRGEQVVRLMPFALPEQVWDDAQARSSTLPFFIGPDLVQSPLPTQVAAAIPFVLYDRLPEGATAAPEAEAGLALAQKLGIDSDPDAGFVLAICAILYGADFVKAPWATNILGANAHPRTKVGMLRQQLANDHQRVV